MKRLIGLGLCLFSAAITVAIMRWLWSVAPFGVIGASIVGIGGSIVVLVESLRRIEREAARYQSAREELRVREVQREVEMQDEEGAWV